MKVSTLLAHHRILSFFEALGYEFTYNNTDSPPNEKFVVAKLAPQGGATFTFSSYYFKNIVEACCKQEGIDIETLHI